MRLKFPKGLPESLKFPYLPTLPIRWSPGEPVLPEPKAHPWTLLESLLSEERSL